MLYVPESGWNGQLSYKFICYNRLPELYSLSSWLTDVVAPVQLSKLNSAVLAEGPFAFWQVPTKSPPQLRCQPQPRPSVSWISRSQPGGAAPMRLRDSVAARGRTSGSLRAFR